MADVSVTNNTQANQFEFTVDGKTAVLQYKLRPGRIAFLHTEVPKEMEGHGIGGRLAQTGLEYAAAQGLKVAPLCPFVASYIKRHREFANLAAEEYRAGLWGE